MYLANHGPRLYSRGCPWLAVGGPSENTRRWSNVGVMLYQRLWRWHSIAAALGECVVLVVDGGGRGERGARWLIWSAARVVKVWLSQCSAWLTAWLSDWLSVRLPDSARDSLSIHTSPDRGTGSSQRNRRVLNSTGNTESNDSSPLTLQGREGHS